MNIPVKYHRVILILLSLFTLANSFMLMNLQFDFRVEHLFPQHHEDLRFYQDKITRFDQGDNYLIIGIETNQGVFSESFLRRFHALTLELDSLSEVRSASSITTLSNFVIEPIFRVEEQPFIHLDKPELLQKDSLLLTEYMDVREKFISSRNQGVCMYLELVPDLSDPEKKAFMDKIRMILKEYPLGEYHFSGNIEVENGFEKALKEEMFLLLGISLILIVVVLYIVFQSWLGIIIPGIIILLTMVWTMGTLAFFGVSVNTMTVIIPSIIQIVALSDVIHIMSRFREENSYISDRREAIRLALKDIGLAIFLTSLTTAFGFLTLGYADIGPFIHFGIFTALGVFYAWFLAIFLLPVLLIKFPPFYRQRHIISPANTRSFILKLYHLTVSNPRKILITFGVGMLIAGYGISGLKVDSTLYDELSAGDEYSASLKFFDQHFSGIRPVEIYIEQKVPGKTVLGVETVRKMDSLEQYLLKQYGVNSVYSIATQFKRMNRSLRRGMPRHFRLPENQVNFEWITQYLDSAYENIGLPGILTADYSSTLVQAKIHDIGSHEIKEKNIALREKMNELFPPDEYLTRITGKALLLDKSNEVIAYNLGYGLLTAILIVSVIMGVLFRSVKMAVIALIPNVLPLVFIAGIMGLWGIGLKMSTAVIFTISFGIAVDDTIHFLSRYKTELARGNSPEKALQTTYVSTGKAIILTTIILVLGFGVLMFSQFATTFTSGFFISLTLVLALLSDLFLLPALLVFLNKKTPETTVPGV